jgi:hypothetical protein
MKKKKIEFASDDRVGYLQTWVDQVMEVVCRISGINMVAFVSDESMIGDFTDEGDDQKISKELEVEASDTDYIVDVAQRLKNKFG